MLNLMEPGNANRKNRKVMEKTSSKEKEGEHNFANANKTQNGKFCPFLRL